MSVLDREALLESPLADLQSIASELGIDGFRRLRKADLADAIVERQGGSAAGGADDADDGGSARDEPARPRRARGTGTRRSSKAQAAPEDEDEAGADDSDDDSDDEGAQAAERPARRSRSRGGRGRGRSAGRDRDADSDSDKDEPRRGRRDRDDAQEERTVEGTVELAGNGSAFVRVSPPEPSDEDVYISAAQVRRCELVTGDTVSGPARPPRRSERFPSLIRVETINGAPADEVSEGTRYDDLPITYATERLVSGADDPTVKAIEELAPFGKGSRVVIAGAARAGKTESVRRIAAGLAGQDGIELAVVLAGVRPEETAEWANGPAAPVAATSFAASAEAQGAAVEQAVEQAKRQASRGADAVVVVDSLDGLAPAAARKALAAARNIADGGSLTVIATASRPLGGETTVVVLDAARTATREFPAVDLAASGTIRPELLVGESAAGKIARERAKALGR